MQGCSLLGQAQILGGKLAHVTVEAPFKVREDVNQSHTMLPKPSAPVRRAYRWWLKRLMRKLLIYSVYGFSGMRADIRGVSRQFLASKGPARYAAPDKCCHDRLVERPYTRARFLLAYPAGASQNEGNMPEAGLHHTKHEEVSCPFVQL